jgi:hypothetical protein
MPAHLNRSLSPGDEIATPRGRVANLLHPDTGWRIAPDEASFDLPAPVADLIQE